MPSPEKPTEVRTRVRSAAPRRSSRRPSPSTSTDPASQVRTGAPMPCYHVENWKVRGVDHPALADD